MCGYDLRWMTQLYLESVGRAYWLMDRAGDAGEFRGRSGCFGLQLVRRSA